MALKSGLPTCPHCGKEAVRFGRQSGKQQWWCQACKRKFSLSETPQKIADAIVLRRQGLTLRQIGRELGVREGTVSRWLKGQNVPAFNLAEGKKSDAKKAKIRAGVMKHLAKVYPLRRILIMRDESARLAEEALAASAEADQAIEALGVTPSRSATSALRSAVEETEEAAHVAREFHNS